MRKSYLASVLDSLRIIEQWRRERLTPEERAAEDRVERLRLARDGVLIVAAFAAMGGVTLLPWAIGITKMGSWAISKVLR